MELQRTYVLRSGLASGLRKRGGLGIRQLVPGSGDGLTAETRFLVNHPLAGKAIFDVGGADGIYTIFFASRAGPEGEVVTFEPDRANVEKIRHNVELNGFENVTIREVAVSNRPGELEFVYPIDRGRGTASAELVEHHRADSGAELMVLPATSIDAELAAGARRAPDFVKIDAEGLELAVLEGMSESVDRSRPEIFVELHGLNIPSKEENARRVVQWLDGRGYRLLHVESGRTVTPANSALAREGHLYAS